MIDMSETIFASWFSLSFFNKDYEKKYKEKMERKVVKSNKYVTSLLSLASVGVSIGYSFCTDEYFKKSIYKVDLYMTYITTLYFFIFIFVSFFSKKLKVIKFVQYCNYFFLAFIGLNLRYLVLSFSSTNNIVYYILYTAEILIRLLWIKLGLLSFMHVFVINLVQITIIWPIYLPNLEDNNLLQGISYNLLAYSFTLIIVVIFTYIFEREKKTVVFYNILTDQKAKWLGNILENMNTGFLSFKNTEISYVNSCLCEKIKKFVKNCSVETVEGISSNRNNNNRFQLLTVNSEGNNFLLNKTNISHSVYVFINWLLVNINIDGVSDVNLREILTDFKKDLNVNNNSDSIIVNNIKPACVNISPNSDQVIVEKFHRSLSQVSGINNFMFIGDAKVETDDCEYSYEIFCRKNNVNELDLLFNDVTRSKTIEKENAEFHYKTLFLSKVAHEFKNPLICIDELITDIYERMPLEVCSNRANEFNKSNPGHSVVNTALNTAINTNTNINSQPNTKTHMNCHHFTELKSSLFQIKSLSNFLLVLVKDLNFFSQLQKDTKVELNNSCINVKELVEFCKDITESLLKKANKLGSITFSVKIMADVPLRISSDEWRLKQILINLLSNAVKFTLYGEIILEISEEKDKITFLIKA